MWDLFDFDRDGKTSLFEKVVGIELLERSSQDEDTTIDEIEADDDHDVDDSDDFDADDEDLNDIDDEFGDDDSF